MDLSLDTLKEELAKLDGEFEQAKAHVSRCDGASQMLKFLITKAESLPAPPVVVDNTSET